MEIGGLHVQCPDVYQAIDEGECFVDGILVLFQDVSFFFFVGFIAIELRNLVMYLQV